MQAGNDISSRSVYNYPMRRPGAGSTEGKKFRAEVGNRLRLVRRVLDLNQGEFGERAGIQRSTYSQIENGERLPSIESAIALCDAYRISLDWIFRGQPGDMSIKLWDGIRALQNATEHNS